MNPETLATFIAGILGVPLIQIIKRYTKLTGPPMAFVAFLLAWPIAVVALITLTDLTFGQLFASPENLMLHGSAVAGIAFLTYEVIKDRMGLGA